MTLRAIVKEKRKDCNRFGCIHKLDLVNVIDIKTGHILLNQCSFRMGKMFSQLNTEVGDLIEFKARVTWISWIKSFQIERPTSGKIIDNNAAVFSSNTKVALKREKA